MLRRPKKVILTLLVILILASSTFAFAAANTITFSNAGFKASDITGYAVTNVAYDLNATDPTMVMIVTFTINTIDANGLRPLVVKLSTSRTAGNAAVLTDPPVAMVPAATADWTRWTCSVAVGAVGPWVVTCTAVPVPGLALQGIYSIDIVASSSLDAVGP